MHSMLRCVWAVMMTLTVVFGLFPQAVLCHLGSALRTGADGKHPMMNHVRVSREPQRRMDKDELDTGDSVFQTSRIKNPSLQHRILHFHSTGQTSSGPNFMFPSKNIVSEYPAGKSLPVYPVASLYGKVGSRYMVKSTSKGTSDTSEDQDSSGNDSWENYGNGWKPNLLPEPENPTFTPYIGARALGNIPKFFEHLRENLEAIRANQQGTAPVSSVPQKNEVDVDKSLEMNDMEKIATPTRRGFSSNPEPATAESLQGFDVGDGNDLTNRDSRSSSSSFILANRFNRQPIMGNGYTSPEERTRELMYFLGHGRPDYSKANNYNPSWLFTNLGLGKRSDPRISLY